MQVTRYSTDRQLEIHSTHVMPQESSQCVLVGKTPQGTFNLTSCMAWKVKADLTGSKTPKGLFRENVKGILDGVHKANRGMWVGANRWEFAQGGEGASTRVENISTWVKDFHISRGFMNLLYENGEIIEENDRQNWNYWWNLLTKHSDINMQMLMFTCCLLHCYFNG